MRWPPEIAVSPAGQLAITVLFRVASSALTPDYALVGQVTKGMNVVDLIGMAPVSASEQPVDPIVMQSVKVEER